MMISVFLRSVVLFAVLAIGSVFAAAQPAGVNGNGNAAKLFNGETLVYDGKVSRLKIGVSVADLTFVASSGPGPDELLVKTSAVSKGTLLRLFKYSFVQEYQSIIDLTNFRILKTIKHDVQKERVRDSEALFNYAEHRVTFVETDPKDVNRPPRRIASELSDSMQDMVSTIYAFRLQPLAVGKKFDLSVSDSGLVYKLPVSVTGREQVDSVLGKVWCYKVEPEVFGHDRLIEQKGRMVIWMTDDSRHIPVRAKIDSQYGKIDIKLRSAVTPK